VIAAAVELGFVPYYTTLACRRLRYIIALIDLDIEEGLVEDRITSDRPADHAFDAHYEFSRWGFSPRDRARETWCGEGDCLTWPKEGVA
jgi:hypothetical protein